MATMVGTQTEISKFLISLTELEYDAIEAYRAAVDRLDTPEFQAQLRMFQSDHERHVVELDRMLQEMNVEPPKGGDIKRVLTKGKVVLADLAGDRAILMAMKTNEDDTNTAYERAVNRGDLPASVRAVMSSHLADERRHRAWIEQQLGLEDNVSSSPHRT
jgi:uncharacterized protein (TIGR02284 family)